MHYIYQYKRFCCSVPPWKVTAEIVEERIQFKHNNSRIELALRNARVHRPGLHLPTDRTSTCSNSSESTA